MHTLDPLLFKPSGLAEHLHSISRVEEQHFVKDHWTTLLYINTQAVDLHGYPVLVDPRMRSSRATLSCLRAPLGTPDPNGNRGATPIDRLEHCTFAVAVGGQVAAYIPDHDDWSCLFDMAVAGYFDGPGFFERAAVLQFSMRGRQVLDALQEHKRRCRTLAGFCPPGGDNVVASSLGIVS